MDYDVNPAKKGWEKLKLSIPPNIRSRHIDDPVFGADWKDLLNDFDAKFSGLTSG